MRHANGSVRFLAIIVSLGFLVAGGLRAQAPPPAPAAPPARVVLDNDSYYRVHYVFKTPVVLSADGELTTALSPVAKKPTPIPDYLSPLPPADWMNPDLDDSEWARRRGPHEVPPASATGRSPAALHSASRSAMICIRGKFLVPDPARAGDLTLTLEYVGGVCVYLNGRELTRAHLPAGTLGAATLAEKYPDDLYCEPKGMFLQFIQKNPDGFQRRYRRLADVTVPAAQLRKGSNVLAVAVYRAPVNAAAIAAKRIPVSGMYRVPGLWAYAGLRTLRLTAAAAAVTPNVARPKGVQVWTVLPFDTVRATDYGDPAEPLRPIRIAAVRNGHFSGRLIVSSNEAISGLKVTAPALAHADGGAVLPASCVRVRWAQPAVAGKSWNRAYRYDGLHEQIPTDVPVVVTRAPRESYLGQPIAREGLSMGALAPIWITVRVPKDARPGRYDGAVRVQADGLAATDVPIELTVRDWALAEPRDFRVRNLAFLSPDSLAAHYGVPLWSDRHFELMGKSMALMAEVNSRQVVLDLAIGFHGAGSNTESVVRWIRKPDGSFSHDFTVLDKYLDLIGRTLSKPLPLRLNCWGEVKDGKWTNVQTVTRLDPATGELSPLDQPPPGTAESVAFWKPVLTEVRKRLEARGWFDVASVGHNSYCWEVDKRVVDTYSQIWPDGVWSFSSHNARLYAFRGTEKGVSMPIRYGECVWVEGRLIARGYRALLKPRNGIWCSVARNRHRDYSPIVILRALTEEMIMRGHDGVGQLGADLFPMPTNRPGRYRCINCGRGGLGPTCSTMALLYPAPGGPVPTERFEMFREGVQLAEAILFLERTLASGRLPAALSERINRYLARRAEAFLEHWSAARLTRDVELLSLCAEAAQAGG